MMDAVSILEVVSPHVELRRAGREFVGLCPFHAEKTPSFHVNEEKGVMYCHGCHEGGDAFTFIQKMHGVDFRGALKILGKDSDGYRPDPEIIRQRRRREAVAAWAHGVSVRLRDRLREIGNEAHVARKVRRELSGADVELLREREADLRRQWEILSTLDDDIATDATAMYETRAEIDSILEAACRE